MNIALPILLLVFGALSFWVLNESSLKWYVKTTCISIFCIFTVIFWSSIHTFLGWAALEDDMPEKVLIHWVIVKEPNKLTEYNGRIFILLQSVNEPKSSALARFFGYRKEKVEPRFYGLKYNRGLHEKLEGIKGRLKKGQPVAVRLTKTGKKGESRKGKANGELDEGGGSESQEQDWELHELQPSDIHSKPER